MSWKDFSVLSIIYRSYELYLTCSFKITYDLVNNIVWEIYPNDQPLQD